MKEETKPAFKKPSVPSLKAHQSSRAAKLREAINDCHNAGFRAEDAWIKELLDLNKTFNK